MFNRDKAMVILERHDPRWDYEDMSDEELMDRLVNVIKCSSENRMGNTCRQLDCRACWEKTLSA